MDVFNIHLEFDSRVFRDTVEYHIIEKKKAYVCVVDANVISIAQKDSRYREVINNATINTCDGSSISTMVNRIYGTNYHPYSGPDLFEYYIERPYKHLLLGNRVSVVEQIRSKIAEKGLTVDLQHMDVPFLPVEKFDYEGIAKQINEIQPDMVWVSLGAPKQEVFVSNLFPFVNQGVFFGIGAALNFYAGDLRNNKKEIGGLRFIWLERIFKEPKKQLRRVGKYLLVMPKIYFEERRRARTRRV